MESSAASRHKTSSSQMCVQVQGEDISLEEYPNDDGWCKATEGMSRLRQRVSTGESTYRDAITSSSKEKSAKSSRITAIRAARMPAMPTEEIKVVVGPRGGLDILKAGTTNVAAAIMAAARIENMAGTRDTICPKTQQNIMVVSTPSEEMAAKYARIQSIKLQGKLHEVSAYRTAPHDTVKGVIRGIPTEERADKIDRNIVNDRNPLAVGVKRIGGTTTVIVVF